MKNTTNCGRADKQNINQLISSEIKQESKTMYTNQYITKDTLKSIKDSFLILMLCLLAGFGVSFLSLVPEAQAAEVVVNTTVNTTNSGHVQSSPASVCVSTTECYIFYLNSTGGLAMSSSTNGGATWPGEVVVDTTNTTDVVNFAIWYDGWTAPGTTTTYIHIASTDSSVDDVYYIRYDIAARTFSTPALATTQAATCIVATSPCTTTITKASNNVIYMGVADASDIWVVSCSTTCTTAGNWTERTGTGLPIGDDHVILTPVTGNNNVLLTVWDISADIIYALQYSATSSSWQSSTTVGSAKDDNVTYDAQLFSMAISNTGQTALALVDDANDYTTQDHDINFYTFASTTGWTARTNPVTDASGGLVGAKVFFSEAEGAWYVIYGRRTTIGTNTTGNIYYKRSLDNGTTWSAEFGPVNDNADDIYGLDTNFRSAGDVGVWWNYTTAPRADQIFNNFILLPIITLSGTLYSDEGVTPLTSSRTIKLAIATSTTNIFSTTTTNGSWSITFDRGNNIATGTKILAFVDNASEKASAFTTAKSASNINGLNLYQNRIRISHETLSGTSTTNADLSFYDRDDDSDIMYTANSNNLVTQAGQELYVVTGKTFAPGGAVTLGGNAGSGIDGDLRLAYNPDEFEIDINEALTLATGRDSSGNSNGTGGAHSFSLVAAGNYLYVGKGGDATACNGTAGNAIGCEILFFDITNPSSPTLLAGRDTSGSATGIQNLAITYMAASGNYLYVGKTGSATACNGTPGNALGCEIMIFDISSSTNPILVAGRDSSGDSTGIVSVTVNSLGVSGNYLYVSKTGNATACNGTPGNAIGCELLVFNLSSSTNPTLVAGRDSSGDSTGIGGSSMWSQKISGNYVYIGKGNNATACNSSAGNAIGCELLIFDISSSTNPTFVAGRDSGGDSTGTGSVGFLHINVANNAIYAAKQASSTACVSSAGNAFGCELIVFDISSSTNPTFAAGLDSTGNRIGTGSKGNLFLDFAGDYLYVGSESNATACNGTPGNAIGCELQVYDVSSSTNPILVAGRDVTGSSNGIGSLAVYSLAVSGNYLYVGQAANATACNGTPGNAIGCELIAYNFPLPSAGATLNLGGNFTLAGSWYASSTTAFNPNNYSVIFNATTTGKVISGELTGDSAFGSTTFNGSGGGWTFADNAQVVGPLLITSGTVTAPSGTLSVTGNFTNNANFDSNDGTLEMASLNSYLGDYLVGRDLHGLSNGTTSSGYVIDLYVSGNYLYLLKFSNTTACDGTAGNSIGCELTVFDISEPTNPTLVAGRDTSGSSNGTGGGNFSSLAISGNYLYVGKQSDATACNGTPGNAIGCELMVFDISTPSNPTLVVGRDASGSSNGTGNIDTEFLTVSGSNLYVSKLSNATACNGTPGNAIGCEILVFDISTPTNPTLVAGRDASGSSNGTGALTTESLNVVGDYLYVGKSIDTTACNGTPGNAIGCELMVFDISTPSNPTLVAGRDGSGSSNGTSGTVIYSLVFSDNNLYLGKVGDATACNGTPGNAIGCELMVFDISTPSNPTLVAVRDASGNATGTQAITINSLWVLDNYLYVGKGSDGTNCNGTPGNAIGCEILVFDISSTTNPSLVTGRDSSGASSGTGNTSVNDIFISDNYLHAGGSPNGTACNNTPGNSIGCELKVYEIPSITSNLSGSLTAGNAPHDVIASGTVATANDVALTNLIINADKKLTTGGTVSIVGDFTNNGEYVTSALGTWASTSAAGNNDSWTSVTYGNGKYVAVGNSGDRVMYSTDGITWATTTAGGDDDFWYGVTYGNGKYVAVGNSGDRVMYSTDGITWATTTGNGGWSSITYGNGKFVAVGVGASGNHVMYSTDGITWSTTTAAGNNDTWRGVTYGNGKYVAVGNYSAGANDGVMYSTDGLTWITTSASGNDDDWNSVTYGNGLFVAVGTSGDKVMYSTDGITWVTGTATGNDDTWRSVTYANGKFVAVGSANDRAMYSNNGITWATTTAVGDNDGWQGVTYGNGKYVAVSQSGDRVMYSQVTSYTTAFSGTTAQTASGELNFSTLEILNNSATTTFMDEVTADHLSIPTPGAKVEWPVGKAGEVWTSSPAADNDDYWNDVTYGNGKFVAVGVGLLKDHIMYSTDGITWATTTDPSSTGDWQGVTYANGQFVAVGNCAASEPQACVMTSSDGISWTNQYYYLGSSGGNTWQAVTYGNGKFVAVASGASNDRVMYSTDGITWATTSAAGNNDSWTGITYGNGKFVAVAPGSDTEVMTSSDGINWTEQSVGGGATFWQSVTYGEGLFVAVSTWNGGIPIETMYSSDGINWVVASPSFNYRPNWYSVTYGNGRFVAVGDSDGGDGQWMTSDDGITWSSITPTAGTYFWYGVTYGNGRFVAVGNSASSLDRVMYSLPGVATSTFGTVSIAGSSGNEVRFTSSVPGSKYGFHVTGAYDILRVNVTDSSGLSDSTGSINATSSTDGGNNTGWNFILSIDPITLSGILYADEGFTEITTGKTIKLAVGTTTISLYSTTTNSGTGAWTFNLPSNEFIRAGTKFLVFVDGDSVKANVFTKASSSASLAGLDLYQNRVIVRNEGGTDTRTTNTDLAFYDNDNDTDLMYNATTSLLSVTAGSELHIASSTTFAPGGAVTVRGNVGSGVDGSFHLSASSTYTAAGTTTIAGNLLASTSATYTPHSLGTIFNATTTGKFITAPTNNLGNLTFNGSGGAWAFTKSATTSNFTITSGSVTAPTSTLTVTGNYTNNGTFNNNNGTLNLLADGGVNLAGNLVDANAFYNLTFNENPEFGTVGVVSGAAASEYAYDITNDGTYLYIAGNDDSGNWRIEKRLMTTGELDTNFGTAGVVSGDAASGIARAITNDGTYLYIAGNDDSDDWRIEKRLMSTGAVDTNFGTSGVVTGAAASEYINAITNDGTYLYIAGNDASANWRIEKRLMTTGAVDNGFGTSGVISGDLVSDSADAITTDGTYLYIAGIDSSFKYRIEKRLMSTGATSTDFGTSGVVTGATANENINAITNDGTYLYIAGFDISSSTNWRIEKRLMSTGAVDTNFGTSGVVSGAAPSEVSYAITNDGTYLYIAGYDASINWRIEKRLMSTGATSTDFGTSGVITGDATSEIARAITNDGTYLYIAGHNSSTNWRIEKRLMSTGEDPQPAQYNFNANARGNDVTINSGATVVAPANLSIAGNFTNSGTYTPGTGTTTFSGTSAQTVSGTLAFTNLEITNNSGTTTFNNVVTANNLTIKTPGAKVAWPTGSGSGGWASTTAAGNNDSWYSVAYGNGKYVAVGVGADRVMYSTDGVTWATTSAAGNNDSWYGVTYGNSKFVAVGTGPDRVMTSSDGITWATTSAAGNDDDWYAVTYGNGLFVAVGAGFDYVMTSSDGTNWTARSAAGDNDSWNSVTYGNGLFVAVGNSNDRIIYSSDGTNWTAPFAAGDDDSWQSVTYGNGLFVAVGIGPDYVMTSPDGDSWTARSAAGDNDSWYDVTYSNSQFVAVGSGPDTVMTSSNGTTWSAVSAVGNNDSWKSITDNGGGGLVAVGISGDRVMYSLPGVATSTFGTVSVAGSSGNEVRFTSAVPGTKFGFHVTGAYDILRVNVTDSSGLSNSTGAINATSSTNGGNTNGWNFITASTAEIGLAANQEFYITQATTSLGTVTITESGATAANDLRITIATTSTNFRFNTGTTNLTFTGSESAKVSNPVSYTDGGATLIIPVSNNFTATGTLIINGIQVGSFASVSTSSSQLGLQTDGNSTGTAAAVTTQTIKINGLVTIANHDAGQASNKFSFANRTDTTFLAFKLTPTGEGATTTDLVVTLRGIQAETATKLSNFKLYRDINNDGDFDGGDTLVSTGVYTHNGQHGAITFSSDFLTNTNTNYIVTGNTTNIARGDAVVFTLLTNALTTVGTTTNRQSSIVVTMTDKQHERFGSSGGGSSARIDTPPPGAGQQEGGSSSGGSGGAGQEQDGANIASDPDFFKPTATGALNNEWTNGSNALLSDGTYATAPTTNLRQTYSNFGFNIPGTNVITGLSVKLDASGSTAAGTIDVALSWNNGSSYTTAKATPTMSGSDVIYTVGDATDLWGRTWTPTEFSPENFQIRVTGQTNNNTLRLDALEIRVYHQAGGGGGGGGGRI